jgi:hypothetical protein
MIGEHEHERVAQPGMLPELAADRLFQALDGFDVGLPGGAEADGELPWPALIGRPRVGADPD